VDSWRRSQSARATDVSVHPVSATTVAVNSPRRVRPGTGRWSRSTTGTGLLAVIPARTVRFASAVRSGVAVSHSPYRPEASSSLRDDPTVGAGLVPPIVRPVRDDREDPTGIAFCAGPLFLADRRLRTVVSRSYRPDRGSQLVPGRGGCRSQADTDLRRSGDFGDRFITSSCSRWPSPATAEDRRAP
jgi:hypothetical protein